MAKVQNFSGISPDLPFTEFDFYELYRQTFATSEPFTEFDFYELYRRTFETSELGKIRKRLPLGEMAVIAADQMYHSYHFEMYRL